MKEDGGKALPQVQQQCLQGGQSEYIGGMSLRDYFAGQALAGFVASNPGNAEGWDVEDIVNGYARSAYAIADGMIAERVKP